MEKILTPFFSPLSNHELNNQLLKALESGGWRIVEEEDFLTSFMNQKGISTLWLFIGTGGTERMVINFIKKIPQRVTSILISHNLYNSLPAAMEIRKYLEDAGAITKILHNNIENISETLNQEINFQRIKNQLDGFRLGLFGEISEWLIASEINEKEIERIWGLEIVHIPILELIDLLKTKITKERTNLMKKFIEKAQEVTRSPTQLDEAHLVTRSLEQLIQKYDLDAFTIECFSLIQQTDTTACYALSYFNDLGVIAGCEGDIPSTFSMILVELLLQQPGFMANVTSVDTKNNSVILAHCTVPIKMTEKYSIDSHFESNKGVAIKGFFKIDQAITIIKIGGRSLTEWYVETGKIIKNLKIESCCRTQVEIKLDGSTNYFLNKSLANHHIMVLGDHKSTFEDFLNHFIKKDKKNYKRVISTT